MRGRPFQKGHKKLGGKKKGTPNKATLAFKEIYDALDGGDRAVTTRIVRGLIHASTAPSCVRCKRAYDPGLGNTLLDRRFGRSASIIDIEGAEEGGVVMIFNMDKLR